MTTDQTITVTVKPEIDREAVEEAAQLAAALFLSSFAVAVLEGVAAEEPPEEVLERVKAETLEKAAHEAQQKYEDMIFHPQTAADAPGPAQTLADLEPCLGDRVRVSVGVGDENIMTYGWSDQDQCLAWIHENGWSTHQKPLGLWIVLEHLDPVTPEGPPVGAGMLVDREGDLWRRTEEGWQWLNGDHWTDCAWSSIREYWRPATPADLARHGVGEDGKPLDAPKEVRQGTPPGLVVTVDGSLLSWEGRNYMPQPEPEAGER